MVSELESVVHIVDDDESLRSSLASLCHKAGFVTCEYVNALQFLEVENIGLTPGCIILDIRMPGMSGIELQASLNRREHGLPIIFLTGYGQIHTAVEALKSGAFYFLEKPISNEKLLSTISDALKVSIGTSTQAAFLAVLSKREREFVSFIEGNIPNKVIARQLQISVKTVEFHKRNIAKKINVSDLRNW